MKNKSLAILILCIGLIGCASTPPRPVFQAEPEVNPFDKIIIKHETQATRWNGELQTPMNCYGFKKLSASDVVHYKRWWPVTSCKGPRADITCGLSFDQACYGGKLGERVRAER